MRGFWADEKIDGKIWNIRNPLYRLIFSHMKKLERSFFKEANGIISLTEKAIPIISQLSGSQKIRDKITVIPCCVDTDFFCREQINNTTIEQLITKLEIDKKNFILSYSGSLSTWYLPRQMLDFFRIFSHTVPNSTFLILTQEDPAPFIKMAEMSGIDCSMLRFYSASRNEMPALLSLSDLSIFFIKPAFSKIASSPTKLGEILSMGIPVLCNAGIGDTDQIVISSGTGLICEKMNEDEYTSIIPKILHLRSSLDKETIRTKAIQYFSLEKGIDSYEKVYNTLTLL